MAHVNTAEAQQNGAFNNGAVGQQFTPLCPWPYVWDRVRKACVLPDEWDWSYEGVLPWGWGGQFTNPARGNELFSYGPPVMSNEGPLGGGLGMLFGLGANCPEGSGRTAAYTGPEGPDGCRCSPGRIWHNGYCQSPQSVSQQAGASFEELGKQYAGPEAWATQPLTESAKSYFRMTRHTVDCKIVKGAVVPGQISSDVMMCSIDGGPYSHGAYAINLNPETAILSEVNRQAAERVSATTGITNVWQHTSTKEAIKAQTDAAQAAQTQAVSQAYSQPPVPPISVDTGTPSGGISTPAPPAGSTPTPSGGYQLPDGSYAPPGMYAEPGESDLLGGLGDIPWYVWVAVAGGAYMVMKKK